MRKIWCDQCNKEMQIENKDFNELHMRGNNFAFKVVSEGLYDDLCLHCKLLAIKSAIPIEDRK